MDATPLEVPEASKGAPSPLATAPTIGTPAVPPPPAPDSFVRDPHKLIAYVVPFPAPNAASLPPSSPVPPLRFVLYTPPPPPLLKPAPDSGAREGPATRVQRKWQEEVRAAHAAAATAPLLSWRGIRGRVTRGVNWAMGQTTSADLDFLTRIPRDGEVAGHHDHAAGEAEGMEHGKEDAEKGVAGKALEGEAVASQTVAASASGGDSTHGPDPRMVDDDSDTDREGEGEPKAKDKATAANSGAHTAPHWQLHSRSDPDKLCRTVKINSMVLLYPPNLKMTEEELRAEFVSSLLRTKNKAQRDAVIATGLLPVTAVLDWALIFVGWVFGGALEVDAIWMASSFRGAKTARSVTQRLASTTEPIALEFHPSDRAAVLEAYLLGACIARDAKRFGRPHWGVPSEADVMTTIGWQAAGGGGAHGAGYEDENWEQDTWERDQVEADLQLTMKKAARGWDKWVDRFVRNPVKAQFK